MKTFKEFIAEAKAPKPDALETIGHNLRRRTPGMKFHITPHHTGAIKLHSLEVPKEQRGKGIGSRAMKGLTRYADKQNQRIVLSPRADKGKKGKLEKFYKRFGFKPNKGINKDFRISDSRIRDPISK